MSKCKEHFTSVGLCAAGLFEQRCVEHLAQQHAPLSRSYRANINKTVKSFVTGLSLPRSVKASANRYLVL
ncbi:hypothetical protein J6590_010484 [Homalodisca vitripennis]|nr:hypothetical protein J6590_010484 [Homalodisca vitripennis]